jgi:hypothetical protein
MILKHATRVDLEVTRAAPVRVEVPRCSNDSDADCDEYTDNGPQDGLDGKRVKLTEMLRATTAAISTSSAARTRSTQLVGIQQQLRTGT